ncbi:hypothetical protein Tco_1391626 [Tanacetum coccineum]|uniref:Uncharacterized protein n=1 Tax=Tanacetum coccineum TaxID=301880 RepID=A0ABQ4WTG2_9ASTR
MRLMRSDSDTPLFKLRCSGRVVVVFAAVVIVVVGRGQLTNRHSRLSTLERECSQSDSLRYCITPTPKSLPKKLSLNTTTKRACRFEGLYVYGDCGGEDVSTASRALVGRETVSHYLSESTTNLREAVGQLLSIWRGGWRCQMMGVSGIHGEGWSHTQQYVASLDLKRSSGNGEYVVWTTREFIEGQVMARECTAQRWYDLRKCLSRVSGKHISTVSTTGVECSCLDLYWISAERESKVDTSQKQSPESRLFVSYIQVVSGGYAGRGDLVMAVGMYICGVGEDGKEWMGRNRNSRNEDISNKTVGSGDETQ